MYMLLFQSALFRSSANEIASLGSSSRTLEDAHSNANKMYGLTLAQYRGAVVVIRKFNKESISLSKQDLVELNMVRDIYLL